MPQYLVAIQHPENYDPSLEGEAMIRDIGALNEEMDAAGARFAPVRRHGRSAGLGTQSRSRLPGSCRGASVPQNPAEQKIT
jgi:hypothetical protein